VTLPELQFEIPPGTQAGVFTTIEGLLRTAADGLEQEQPYRKEFAPEVFAQVDAFLSRLRACADGTSLPFTLTMRDPSGNSFLENPVAPKVRPGPCYCPIIYRPLARDMCSVPSVLCTV
jgi:zinc finger protein